MLKCEHVKAKVMYCLYCCIVGYIFFSVDVGSSSIYPKIENNTKYLVALYQASRTRWERERVDRLSTERNPGVWHKRGLESDGVEGCGVGGQRFMADRRKAACWKEEVDAARHRQDGEERGKESGKRKLLSHTKA